MERMTASVLNILSDDEFTTRGYLELDLIDPEIGRRVDCTITRDEYRSDLLICLELELGYIAQCCDVLESLGVTREYPDTIIG
jgi:hypothetical protein